MVYDIPVRFFYYFARFSVLFPFLSQYSGNKYSLCWLGLITLLHHVCRFCVIFVTKEPLILLAESSVPIALKAVEFVFVFFLCLIVFVFVSKNVRLMYSALRNEHFSIIKLNSRQVLAFNGTVSAFSWFCYCSVNISAILTLYVTRKTLEDWKTVFEVLEFMFCSGLEIIFINYYFSVGYVVKQNFVKINSLLKEKKCQKLYDKHLSLELNSVRIRFLIVCELYKYFCYTFQNNGIVYIIWLLMSLITSITSLVLFDVSHSLEYIIWWTFLPIKTISMIYLCYSIYREARKARNTIKEIDGTQELELLIPKGKVVISDSIVPNCFGFNHRFVLSMTALAIVYMSAFTQFTENKDGANQNTILAASIGIF